CCALARAAWRRARVFRKTSAGEGANRVRLAAFSAANLPQFANRAGSAPLSEAKPAQFGNTRARGGTNLLAPLPHCQTRPQSRAETVARRRGRKRSGQTSAAVQAGAKAPTPT